MSTQELLQTRKDLLTIGDLSREEILQILDTAKPFKDLFTRSVKKVPTLRGKTVLNLFYEPSTRTRTSFEIAAKRLSADVTNFAVSTSSVVKGESILDTIDTLQAMQVDYMIVRHSVSGVPEYIARHTHAAVVNAGDGHHAHPTQAMLDAFTFREVYPDMKGKRIVVAGDILHSRVARSVFEVMHILGVEVATFGPATLVPETIPSYVKILRSFDEVFEFDPHVLYLLRLQLERQKANFFPSMREYHKLYGVTTERFKILRERGTWIMHPGPVNRGVELVDDVMTYERTLINQQVENGIATRMAILYHLTPEEQKRLPLPEEIRA
ncbi:aspartate carbamoyltransferase catalytic subunit [Kiritimatiellaeota bacterium B1221]|nr:aspartate carbamoyltransferase catalytic subunit [Kiritimatiellaeota bacterium B1221]